MRLPSGLVTFLFTDIEGSTRLAQMLGTNYRRMLTEHRRLLLDTIAGSGGSALFAEGDSLFGAFPDARAALSACGQAQLALAGHEWPAPEARPLVRMGLHTGPAQPEAGEYSTPVVHRAARIAAAAHGGQVLCSAATAQHAGDPGEGAWLLDLGLHRLRGFDDRERLYQLVSPGLPREFPRPRTAAENEHNLPSASTRFIGRTAERAELSRLLCEHRLVTVVGPGGAGKTRLAVEAAGSSADDFPDGAWFVDFAQVTDAEQVPATVALALGLRPEPGRKMLDTLGDFVAPRRLLLVLDTCDAQPAAIGALVGRLFSAGRGLVVLAASRQPLGRPGEVVWRIPPMSVRPGPDGQPGDAVALLLDRAAAARGGRRPDEREVVPLRQVAQRLDGMPLALELAAARLRVLSATELVSRLDDPLALLDAGVSTMDALVDRHGTLQATVNWSYRTLDPEAARLLRSLAVFAGPVDLPAIERLTGSDPLGALSVLVDKSLVQADLTPSGTRFRMLDAIRSYALRRLVEAGEQAAVRDRHVSWVQHAVAGDGSAPISLYSLDPYADELRAALDWSATGGSARDGLQLAGALAEWWRERHLAEEGRRWLYRLYERATPIPDSELAAAYHLHATLAEQPDEAERFGLLAEQAARRAGEPRLLVRVLAGRAVYLLDADRLAEAERAFRAVLDLAHRHRAVPEALPAVYGLAELLWRREDLDEAAELLAAARTVEQARPEFRGARTVDWLLGLVALRRGDLVAAHEHLVVALRWRLGYGFHVRAGEAVQAFAVRCALGGDHLTAAQLFGVAATAGASSGSAGGYWRGWQDTVRAALGDPAFDSAFAAGTRLTLGEAVAVALTVEHPDLAAGSLRFTDADSRAS